MRVKDLITSIRLRVGDMQRARYSDYEVLRAVNDALKMLWIMLAENFSSIPRVRREITLIGGIAPLPEKYYSLVSISDNACIDGFTIRGAGDKVQLEYNALPPELTLDSDDIAFADDDIAYSDDDPLVPGSALLTPAFGLDMTEISAAVLQGNTEAAVSIAASTAKRVSQKREYSKIPAWRHFS